MSEDRTLPAAMFDERQRAEYASLSPMMMIYAERIRAFGDAYLSSWLTGRISMRDELELERIEREIALRSQPK